MIKNLKLEDIEKRKQITTKENKEIYGEVITPFCLVNNILNNIPVEKFKDASLRWLDPGTGTGNFSIILYYKLIKGLSSEILDIEERKIHIIKNMIYMVELRKENIKILKELFGVDANIYEGNYLNYINGEKFDVIIGNPPFNYNGRKKVPTNIKNNKNEDGLTIWGAFIIKSINLLKQNTGMLCIFIPSIWLKPDKERNYYLLTQYDIKKLNCITNTETNKIFKGNAQTPTCYFLLTKRESDKIITIFDKDRNEYIEYKLTPNIPIPVFGQSIVNKLQKYCYINNRINTISVIKTNMPPKNALFSNNETKEHIYPNVTTCVINKKTKLPELQINYSNKPMIFSQQTKIILAHKMYGLPYLDISGEYGISNRDNYVIIRENITDLIKIYNFLSTKTAKYLFKTTKYRMSYLEKYAFELIPDITKLPNFPEEINDNTVAEYFGFDKRDINNISTNTR